MAAERIGWTQTKALSPTLNQYWLQLFTSRRGQQLWRRWSSEHPLLEKWNSATLQNPMGSTGTDSMQHVMVALSQAGQTGSADLAILTLLMQLRPGLTRIAHLLNRQSQTNYLEAATEVQAHFFEVLMSHSLKRRPNKIAANLVLDTRQQISRSRKQKPGQQPTQSLDDETFKTQAATETRNNYCTHETSYYPAADLIRTSVNSMAGTEKTRSLATSVAYQAWIMEESHKNVASLTGISQQHVSTQLHRLRQVVRGELDD